MDWVLDQIAGDREEACAAYARFVDEGAGVKLWSQCRQQIFLGRQGFVERVLRRRGVSRLSQEIPKVQRRLPAKSLVEYQADTPSRNDAIREAWASQAYTLREIGARFGLHYGTVSRIANAKDKT